jgi:hypothetical protein
MAQADHDSDCGPSSMPPPGPPVARPAAAGAIWLEDGVPACACPDCGAPVSIRSSLRLANCRRCGSSIALSQEQQRQAAGFLGEKSPAPSPRGRPAGSVPPPLPGTRPPPVSNGAVPPPAPPPGRRERAGFVALLAFLFSRYPLASLIGLTVLLAAVGLSSVGLYRALTSGDAVAQSASDGREGMGTGQGSTADAAAQGAESEPGTGAGAGPARGKDPNGDGQDGDVEDSAAGSRWDHMLDGRSPQVRSEIALRAGATPASEAAVALALKWLAAHQNADGSWSLHAFQNTPECHGQCSNPAHQASDMSGTAMALLPFLGAGNTHLAGQYKQQVQKGLDWLLAHQGADGDLRGPGNFGRMYAHGQASIVLCEAYALTEDKQLRTPAQKALNFIVKAQHPAGGWRYRPKEPGDTSVVGWQLMALNSGRMAHLSVPDETLDRAMDFLDSVQTDKVGGTYGYQPAHGTTHVMTAEALLCRQYLGWARDSQGLQDGVKFLLDSHLPNPAHQGVYYWYYATQMMHHMGGREWSTWNAKMRDALVDLQEKQGHAAGSWLPRHDHGEAGGRLYQTALCTCTLEVYYRHLPLYGEDAVTPEAAPEVPKPVATKTDVPERSK